jgi:hypothetical protein
MSAVVLKYNYFSILFVIIKNIFHWELWNLHGVLGLPGNSQHVHFWVIRNWPWKSPGISISNYLIRPNQLNSRVRMPGEYQIERWTEELVRICTNTNSRQISDLFLSK